MRRLLPLRRLRRRTITRLQDVSAESLEGTDVVESVNTWYEGPRFNNGERFGRLRRFSDNGS